MIAGGAAGIDGISETDGLEATGASLDLGLEGGDFIAQDGRDVSPLDGSGRSFAIAC